MYRFSDRKHSRLRRPVLRRITVAFAIAAAFGLTGVVANEVQRDHGLYVGAGAGLSYLNPRDNNAEIRVEEQKDLGAQLFLGFDLGHRFGVELQFSDLGTAELTDNASLDYQEAALSGLIYSLPAPTRPKP